MIKEQTNLMVSIPMVLRSTLSARNQASRSPSSADKLEAPDLKNILLILSKEMIRTEALRFGEDLVSLVK